MLIYELLLGQGLKGKTSFEKLILRNKSNLHASLERLKIRKKVKSIEELLPENIRDLGNLHENGIYIVELFILTHLIPSESSPIYPCKQIEMYFG